jgi:hypothetical protein
MRSAIFLIALALFAQLASTSMLKKAQVVSGNKTNQSWQDYITNYLINNNQMGKTNISNNAAIIDSKTGVVYASTSGFTVDKDEFANLVDAFNNDGRTSREGGISFNKQPYTPLRLDGELFFLKKSEGGATVAKSRSTFIIATYSSKIMTKNSGKEEPQNSNSVNSAVLDLLDYLESVGL